MRSDALLDQLFREALLSDVVSARTRQRSPLEIRQAAFVRRLTGQGLPLRNGSQRQSDPGPVLTSAGYDAEPF